LREAFEQFDKSGDGMLTAVEASGCLLDSSAHDVNL